MTDMGVAEAKVHPATVVIENNVAALEAALEAARAAEAASEPQRQIAAAEKRVVKAQMALDAAEELLAQAYAQFGGDA